MHQYLFNQKRCINNLKVSLSIAEEDHFSDLKEAVYDYIARHDRWIGLNTIIEDFSWLLDENSLSTMLYQLSRGHLIRLKRSAKLRGKIVAVQARESDISVY